MLILAELTAWLVLALSTTYAYLYANNFNTSQCDQQSTHTER